MKKNGLKIIALSTIFVLGGCLAAVKQINNAPLKVEAAQYLDDYSLYAYSGTYYDNIDFNATDGSDGTLRKAITSLIVPKDFYEYGSSGTNHLSTQLQYADEDPNNSNNMIYLYTRDSVKKNAASSWNREHVWPQSLSNGNWGTDGGGTDILHIRPTYNKTNETRGSAKYGNNNKSGPYYYNEMLAGYTGGSYFEPIDQIKGDVARTIMYMWTAYTGYKGYSTLNILSVFESYDTLLKWHTQDKPDLLEGNRNNYAEKSIQKNRNPFVDHPELAWRFFGDKASDAVKNSCMEAYPADGYNPNQKKITGITISGTPTKTQYYVGESFNPAGLTITASYDDESTKTVNASSCSWSPDPLTEGTTTVTCTYGGKTATYTGITVTQRAGVQGQYGVEFINTADSGVVITNSNISEYWKNNTLVESVVSTLKVFPGTYGLKLGSSSVDGEIVFNLVTNARVNMSKVIIATSPYNNNGTYTAKLDNTTLFNGVSAGNTQTKVLSNISASKLTISSSGRMYINSITVEIASVTPPPSSSSSSMPSSSIPSSSMPPSSSASSISSSSSVISSSEQQSSSSVPASSSEVISSSEGQSSSLVPSSVEESSSSEMISSSEIEEPSIASSSEIPASSEPESSSQSGGNENKKNSGCGGSVTTVLPLMSLSSLIGLVFLFSKKKKK